MPAPTVMTPAGGAGPKWGHGHGGIMSASAPPPPSRSLHPPPPPPSPTGGQPPPPRVEESFIQRQRRMYTRLHRPHTHSALTANPPQGCIATGGRSPTPLEGAQPMPSHCLPDRNCQPQWHL